MKKVLSLIVVIALLVALPVFAFAAESDKPLLVDEAGLLSESEFSLLEEKLNSLSEELNFDIVVVTVDGLDGKSPMVFADDYYDYNGYGYGESHDGCLFLISMEERDWYVSTTGYGITAITDYGIDYIESAVVPYLSSGDYYGAFNEFAETVVDFVVEARNGSAYDIDNTIDGYNPNERSTGDKIKTVLICIAAGLIISLIVTFGIKRSYTKAVKFNRDARNYLVPNSMKITNSYDNFLYSTVTKVKIQTESSSGGSSTHTSSSGTSHGGGGGKF
ncbi:MAG: TPM domain-containing protein [Ruminococcaceae bacterium]|jgi:uncharacterized protein|nr:TPM domain-containing protein [Oscillospiraceae bacterium]